MQLSSSGCRLENIGYRCSLIDDFKGEITVITEGVITTADRDFPKRNPEYEEFDPTNDLKEQYL